MKGGHSLRCTSLRRRVLYIAVATVVSLISAAAGQDEDPNHGVVFIYPTKDQIYNTMDTVNVTYTSPFPTPNLYTFCDGGSRQVMMQRAVGFNATVPIVLNFTSATPCWFNLRPGTLPGFGANSPPFNIIGQERGSGSRVFGPSLTPTISPPPFTTSGSKGEAPTGDPAAPVTGSAGDSTTSPAPTPENSTGGGGLSAAAAAGVGVGVAVGVLVLGVGAFVWFWKTRRSRATQNASSEYWQDEAHGNAKWSDAGRSDAGVSEHSSSFYPVDRRQAGHGIQTPRKGPFAELSSAHMPAELYS